MAEPADTRTAFLKAALWHGDLERANELLAAHPELVSSDIHMAAVLGDDAAVRRFIAADKANVTKKSPPYDGDALNYLCMSKYFRLDPSREAAFLRAATALLDAGADPNTGFWLNDERETALYGAAGVAHHAGMTRLLLARGADPNDVEAVYHSPETAEQNEAMQALVETGRVTPDNLSLMLIRKHDWHDHEGAKYLLEHGAAPNLKRSRGWHAMHHALARSNWIEMFVLLLDHGADPMITADGLTAIARAAREGRADVLDLFERRNIPVKLDGVDRLIAACARNDVHVIRDIKTNEPHLVHELVAMGGTLMAKFTSNWNTKGVRHLLDLGVSPVVPYAEGDGYWDIPANSLPIHIAAWREQPDIVKLLIERGSPVDVPDAKGRTPLVLAVRSCVDSYWTERRSPDSVKTLLDAGASVEGVPFPSGYDQVDALLAPHFNR